MFALVALATLALTSEASARATAGATGEQAEVMVAGASAADARVRLLINNLTAVAQASEVAVKVRFAGFSPGEILKPGPDTERLAARAWIDVRVPATTALYFWDVASGRAAVRQFSFEGEGRDALMFEQTAQAFRVLLDAVVGGAFVGDDAVDVRKGLGLEPQEVSVPAAPEAGLRVTAVAAPPPPRAAWEIGAAYGAWMFSSQTSPQHTASLGLALWSRRGAWAWAPRLELRYALPTDFVVSPELEGRMDAFALRLGVAGARFVKRWRFELGADVGADVLRVDGTAADNSQFRVFKPSRAPSPVARLRGRVAYAGKALTPFLEVAAETGLTRLRYTVNDVGVGFNALDPMAVRPSVMLGIAY